MPIKNELEHRNSVWKRCVMESQLSDPFNIEMNYICQWSECGDSTSLADTDGVNCFVSSRFLPHHSGSTL